MRGEIQTAGMSRVTLFRRPFPTFCGELISTPEALTQERITKGPYLAAFTPFVDPLSAPFGVLSGNVPQNA